VPLETVTLALTVSTAATSYFSNFLATKLPTPGARNIASLYSPVYFNFIEDQ